jgi:hypothetical protein
MGNKQEQKPNISDYIYPKGVKRWLVFLTMILGLSGERSAEAIKQSIISQIRAKSGIELKLDKQITDQEREQLDKKFNIIFDQSIATMLQKMVESGHNFGKEEKEIPRTMTIFADNKAGFSRVDLTSSNPKANQFTKNSGDFIAAYLRASLDTKAIFKGHYHDQSAPRVLPYALVPSALDIDSDVGNRIVIKGDLGSNFNDFLVSRYLNDKQDFWSNYIEFVITAENKTTMFYQINWERIFPQFKQMISDYVRNDQRFEHVVEMIKRIFRDVDKDPKLKKTFEIIQDYLEYHIMFYYLQGRMPTDYQELKDFFEKENNYKNNPKFLQAQKFSFSIDSSLAQETITGYKRLLRKMSNAAFFFKECPENIIKETNLLITNEKDFQALEDMLKKKFNLQF